MEKPVSHFASNLIPLLQSTKNCHQTLQSTSHKQELDDNPNLQSKGQVAGSQTQGFTKTTPGKAEKPFSNFTEHFISEYKFSLEQSKKAEMYLITV